MINRMFQEIEVGQTYTGRVVSITAFGAFMEVLPGKEGSRAQNVMNELNGEKIDIIDYSDDPATYVANALAMI